MNKEEKTAVVAELTDELKGADAVFAIDYRGISVPQAAELREGLRGADTRFRVVKNRLTLRAADAAGTDEIKHHLSGPTALALVQGDVALAAKTIRRLGDEWELLDYKGGLMEGEVLDADSFLAIARLPGREQLDAQFAGIVASPLTGLVRGLGSMVQGLALQLQAIADQGLVSGEAPAEEPKAEESDPDPQPSESPEEPKGEESDPDPDPTQSPEEAPSEEKAPEGEEGGEVVEQTGEGDAKVGSTQDGEGAGSAQDGEEAGGDSGEEETSENSDEDKEDE